MNRPHVNLAVSDLDATVHFDSGLFGSLAAVLKLDHAKWMLDDPRVNFAVSTRGTERGRAAGLDHLGIQVEDEARLAATLARMRAADGPVREDGTVTSCYARSEKAWIHDPDGVACEAFLTRGESTTYYDGTKGSPRVAGEAPVAPSAASCCA